MPARRSTRPSRQLPRREQPKTKALTNEESVPSAEALAEAAAILAQWALAALTMKDKREAQ
jgi:hypothetical protein